jgi:NAD(P)-dependent dehydrogenase (short-subunit alcohol dehydrogenase family)
MSHTRVAVVTGAGQGIGRAIAIRLAEDGMDVGINDLESQRHNLEEVQSAIAARGRRAFVFTGDVSDEQTVKTLVSSVVKALGGVDVVSTLPCHMPLYPS